MDGKKKLVVAVVVVVVVEWLCFAPHPLIAGEKLQVHNDWGGRSNCNAQEPHPRAKAQGHLPGGAPFQD